MISTFIAIKDFINSLEQVKFTPFLCPSFSLCIFFKKNNIKHVFINLCVKLILIISPTNWKLKNKKNQNYIWTDKGASHEKKLGNLTEDIHLQKSTYELELVLGTDFF